MRNLAKALAATAAVATLAFAGTASAAVNLITNGGFVGPNPNGSFVTVGVSSGVIPGWDVLEGNVDWIQGYWPGSDGDGHSIDLNGTTQGKIGQSIVTEIGKYYTIKFDMNANPDFGTGTRVAIIGANGDLGNRTFEATSPTAGPWSPRQISFVADSTSTQITFASGTNTNCCFGAAIDNVSVAVPEPGTWALMIMGFGGAGAMLRRRRLVAA